MSVPKHAPTTSGNGSGEKFDPDQLHRNRIVFVVIAVVFALLLALMVWLVSAGGLPEGGSEDIPLIMP